MGEWCYNYTDTNCSHLHVIAALSPNPIEMRGPIFATCKVRLDPQAMDNLFKGLAFITYWIQAWYERVYITSLFALFSLVSTCVIICMCCWPCILVIFDFMFQLKAPFVYYIFSYFSTCFEQYCAHHQEDLLYIHSIWFFICHSS